MWTYSDPREAAADLAPRVQHGDISRGDALNLIHAAMDADYRHEWQSAAWDWAAELLAEQIRQL